MRTRARGFSLVELLITMLILLVIGAAVLTAFWVFWGAYYTNRDHTDAREEMEYAFQILGADITNVGLGMPNNKRGDGDFSEAFRGSGNPALGNSPVMWIMGERGKAWGGPIMLRWHPEDDATDYGNEDRKVRETVAYGDRQVYVGNELFYTLSVPVAVTDGAEPSVLKVGDGRTGRFQRGDIAVFTPLQENGVRALVDFNDGGRPAGIVAGNDTQRSVRSWLAIPGLNVPLLVEGWIDDVGVSEGNPAPSSPNNSLTLRLAPWSGVNLAGVLGGYEELRAVKSVRVFRNARGELVQEVFGDDYEPGGDAPTSPSSYTQVIANGVSGVVFVFDPVGRTLEMHLATRGYEGEPATGGAGGVQPPAWPVTGDASVNGKIALPDEDLGRRILTGSRIWRIRN